MMFRFAPLLLALAGTLLLAQTDPAAAPAPAATPAPAEPAPKPAVVHVTLTTSMGPIGLELEKERAPITTANFLRYVDGKKLDGVNFYRAMKVGDSAGLVQGGTSPFPAKTLAPIAHEPTSKTGLTHTDGTISMAREAPGTARGDFFIVVGDLTSLDAKPGQPGDNQGFAAFGHVTEGMDIVRKILAAPTKASADNPAMRNQMLAQPVKILTARRDK